MLIDCERFKQLKSLSSFEQWKEKSCTPQYKGLYSQYTDELESRNLVGALPLAWNCLDGKNFPWEKAKLIHFTEKDTQPWHPYPEKHSYKKHQIEELEKLWWTYVSS